MSEDFAGASTLAAFRRSSLSSWVVRLDSRLYEPNPKNKDRDMNKKNLSFIVAIIATSLLAILFLTGASSPKSPGQWEISAISGQKTGLYIMDQTNGDIYFMEDDPGTSSSRARIKKLGNISDAR